MNATDDQITRLQPLNNVEQRDKLLRFNGRKFCVGEKNIKFRKFLVFIRNVCIRFTFCQCQWLNNKITAIDNKTHQEQIAAMDQLNIIRLKDRQVVTVSEAIYLLNCQNDEEFYYHNNIVAYKPEKWVMPFPRESLAFFHENLQSKTQSPSKVACSDNKLEEIALRDYKVDLNDNTINAKLRCNLQAAKRQRESQALLNAFPKDLLQTRMNNNDYYYTNEGCGSMEIYIYSESNSLLRNTTIHFHTDPITRAGVARSIGDRKMVEGEVIPYKRFPSPMANSCPRSNDSIDIVPLVMCGLVDGHHQGKQRSSNEPSVADFVAKRFPSVFTQAFVEWQSLLTERSNVVKIWNAFKQAFVEIDRMSVDKKGGASAIIATVLDDNKVLYVSNVGDCRAILIKPNRRFIQMSEDAKCYFDENNEPNRYARSALKRGGFVPQEGTFKNKVNGVTESARTIGDHQLGNKKTYAHNPRPKNTAYSGRDLAQCCLVLCNSAVTSQASTRQIAKFVNDKMTLRQKPEQIATNLVEAVFRAGSKKNIMASVIPVGKMFQH